MEINEKIEQAPFISPGAYIDDAVIINAGVFIGANAVILAKDQSTGLIASTKIKYGANIGANATILPGLIIGERSVIKPGSVVTRSVPPLAIVEGNPAIITGYVSTPSGGAKIFEIVSSMGQSNVFSSSVKGVGLYKLKVVSDLRGNLTAGEFNQDIPFEPKRFFMVFDVPTAETRGEHAHYQCKQFLICIKGSCNVVADDGQHREEFVLDNLHIGLYLPPMTWGIQYKYSSDAVLLVFASEFYDGADYIRDYQTFLAVTNNQNI